MGLGVIFHAASGDRVMLDKGVIDILERIQRGDGSVGWGGDPRMHVTWNSTRGVYELYRLNENGKDYILNTWPSHEFDTRVLAWLRDHDSWNVDILKKVDQANESRERTASEAVREAAEEVAAVAQFESEGLYLPGWEAPRPKVSRNKSKGK